MCLCLYACVVCDCVNLAIRTFSFYSNSFRFIPMCKTKKGKVGKARKVGNAQIAGLQCVHVRVCLCVYVCERREMCVFSFVFEWCV